MKNSPSDFAAVVIPATASARKIRSPVTMPAAMASAGRAPSVIARATIAVAAGPGVTATTATVVARVRKTPGVIAAGGYSQPLRRK